MCKDRWEFHVRAAKRAAASGTHDLLQPHACTTVHASYGNYEWKLPLALFGKRFCRAAACHDVHVTFADDAQRVASLPSALRAESPWHWSCMLRPQTRSRWTIEVRPFCHVNNCTQAELRKRVILIARDGHHSFSATMDEDGVMLDPDFCGGARRNLRLALLRIACEFAPFTVLRDSPLGRKPATSLCYVRLQHNRNDELVYNWTSSQAAGGRR